MTRPPLTPRTCGDLARARRGRLSALEAANGRASIAHRAARLARDLEEVGRHLAEYQPATPDDKES